MLMDESVKTNAQKYIPYGPIGLLQIKEQKDLSGPC